MNEALQKNKILVLGRSEIDKLGFVNSVAGKTPDKASTGAETSAKIDWRIETRYFHADVEFWMDSTEQLTSDHQEFMQKWLDVPGKFDGLDDDQAVAAAIPVEESMEALQDQLGQVVDAIVFLFDPLDPESFRDILPWARMARMHQPEVMLCVAKRCRDGGEAGDAPAAMKDRWFEWCISNGWEWVDLTDTDPETEYSIERVREALVSNQWQTMTLKDAQKQKREQSQKVRTEQDCRPGDSQSKGQAGCDLLNSAEEPRPEGDKELAEWAAFDEVSKTIDDAHVENLHRTLFSHGRSQTKSGDPSFKDNGGDNDDDDDDDDSNFDMGDIAALMSRIQAMRSEISKIEDPQLARKRAAELAMALAKKT